MTHDERCIQHFFSAKSFAVGGASNRRHKYGNKIFRRLKHVFPTVIPLNPIETVVEGCLAYPNLAEIPFVPASLCLVTPPEVTHRLAKEAVSLGVKNLWIQPGAENKDVKELIKKSDVNFIGDGRCILIELEKADFDKVTFTAG